MSASVGFEHEIARDDDDADGEAWPDGERRRDVELALDDLLPGLVDAVGRTRCAGRARCRFPARMSRLGPTLRRWRVPRP